MPSESSPQILPQYKEYNEVTVTICDDYVVSNINTSGFIKPDCTTHLSSLSITAPSQMQESKSSVGTEGSVSLLDYGGAVFSRMMKFINEESGLKDGAKAPFAPIRITIKCYTGEYNYFGTINDWSVSFSGSVPTIDLKWGVYQPVPTPNQQKKFYGEDGKNYETDLYGTYRSIDAFLSAAKDFFQPCFNDKHPMPKLVYIEDGKEIDSNFDKYLKFNINENETFGIDANVLGKSPNMLINCYKVIADYAVATNIKIKDASGKDTDILSALYGEMLSTKDNKFIIRPQSAQLNVEKKEETKVNDQLVFIQNGAFPAYQKVSIGEIKDRLVIPMTSFSFNMDLQNSTLVSDIWENINGTIQTSPTGSDESSGTKEQVQAEQQKQNGSSGKGSASVVEFECWNVMSFVNNNAGSKIAFLVFDENGNEHPLTANNKGYATVIEASYSISGAVVKARVKATKEFGYTDTSVSKGADSKGMAEQSQEDNENAGTTQSGSEPNQ